MILIDFHSAFLLFSEPETQSEPQRGWIEGTNPHRSNLKKIFTPTFTKYKCEVSHIVVYSIHFVQALKNQTFFSSIAFIISVYTSCYPLDNVRQSQRKLDVVLRTLLYEKQNNLI